jgi:hypothetical protein
MIRPEFDRSIIIDFQRAKITTEMRFLLLRASFSLSLGWILPRRIRVTIVMEKTID